MTDQERLIAFMWKKQQLLPIKEPAYFTDEDAQAIAAWTNKDALRVIKIIKKALKRVKGLELGCSMAAFCPFCIYHSKLVKYSDINVRCEECTYANRHGRCDEYDDEPSTWAEVGEFFFCIITTHHTELLSILEAK
jgi:hypothetical protein